jgi:RimJ/RimL family protein N-acetyltransferase
MHAHLQHPQAAGPVMLPQRLFPFGVLLAAEDVVDQHVKPTVIAFNGGDQRGNRRQVFVIDDNCRTGAACGPDQVAGLFDGLRSADLRRAGHPAAAAGGEHEQARAGQLDGDRPARPPCCARHQSDARFTVWFHGHLASKAPGARRWRRPPGQRAPAVVLETDRLTLREFTEADVDNLFELNSDPEVMRYITGGNPTPREEIRDNIIPFHLGFYERSDGLGTWAAQARSTGEFLGWFHFRPGSGEGVELGYRLRRDAWNKGYATEGSRALIRKGFTDLGVDRVFALTMTVNTASRRVLEKAGLTLVRTFAYEGPAAIEGSEQGEVEYALTKTEWEARGPAR